MPVPPFIEFSRDDLVKAEQNQVHLWHLHALKYERPPQDLWARACVVAFERRLCDEGSLTSGQLTVLAGLDVLDQQEPF
jgi:hypothetical protein